jgi:hypothetical protein
MSGGNLTVDDLVALKNGDPDIIHVTCHGGQDYWTLDHISPSPPVVRITQPTVEMLGPTLRRSKPLVFGNACASAGAAGVQPPGGTALALGPTFLAQGAAAFVGTFAPVTATLAVDFACEFYKRLLGQGLPIGQALWETKKYYSDNKGPDPSWLFYCLYGLPDMRFQIAPQSGA